MLKIAGQEHPDRHRHTTYIIQLMAPAVDTQLSQLFHTQSQWEPVTARPDFSETVWTLMGKHAHNSLGIEATLCGCATAVAFLLYCLLRTIDVKSCLRIFAYERNDHARTHSTTKQSDRFVFP